MSKMFLSRDFFSRSNNFVFHIVQGVPFIISFLFRRQTLQRAQVCNPSKISNCCESTLQPMSLKIGQTLFCKIYHHIMESIHSFCSAIQARTSNCSVMVYAWQIFKPRISAPPEPRQLQLRSWLKEHIYLFIILSIIGSR